MDNFDILEREATLQAYVRDTEERIACSNRSL